MDAYLRELARLERKPGSPLLPPWVEQETRLAAEAKP